MDSPLLHASYIALVVRQMHHHLAFLPTHQQHNRPKQTNGAAK